MDTFPDLDAHPAIRKFVLGTKARFVFAEGRGVSSYFHGEDQITMTSRAGFLSQESYINSLFHELVHWTAPRVSRDTRGMWGAAKEELTAELGAAMLNRHFGNAFRMDYHVEYLNKYSHAYTDRTRVFIEAAQDAHLAVQYLFSLQCEVE